MTHRYVSLWFRYLVTDWFTRRDPALGKQSFILTAPERGRIVVTTANRIAEKAGIFVGMALPDARALVPGIEQFDYKPEFAARLLDALAAWTIRYTPVVQVSGSDGLLLDITGCAHLRGGEASYLKDLVVRLRTAGYEVRGAMADTIGTAWAISRYGRDQPIITAGGQAASLAALPPSSLRISGETAERLRNLGIRTIGDLTKIPRSSLNRRFGQELTLRLCQALGEAPEAMTPKRQVNPYEETLVSSDGIATAEGIAKALELLLARLCERLKEEGKGSRALTLESHRLDGVTQQVTIGTGRPSRNEVLQAFRRQAHPNRASARHRNIHIILPARRNGHGRTG
jgi:protein ImuB